MRAALCIPGVADLIVNYLFHGKIALHKIFFSAIISNERKKGGAGMDMLFPAAYNAATGDNTAIMLIIAAVAVVGVIVTAIIFRKKKRDDDE